MNTEVIKIIEGGLKGDKEKVINYAKVLSHNMQKEGNDRFAKRIDNALQKNNGLIGLDSLANKPIDQESRLDIVDIIMPHEQNSKLYFNDFINKEIEDFINSYEKQDELRKVGIESTNSLLMYGPPGCGKTSLAKYISYKTELPLVTARLDVLLSSLLGSTAKNIRKIFEFSAKRPCILFLDEFDAIAKLRDDKNELGELKRIVNSLLQNIDEFSQNSIIIAATNHHEVLDSAIWRRFSKIIELDKPKEDIIEKLVKDMLNNIDIKVNISDKKWVNVSNVFNGLSPSDIKTVLNSAIRKAILNSKDEVKLANIVNEVYIFKHHSIKDEAELINFLNDNGVNQREMFEFLNISMRKIRENLK